MLRIRSKFGMSLVLALGAAAGGCTDRSDGAEPSFSELDMAHTDALAAECECVGAAFGDASENQCLTNNAADIESGSTECQDRAIADDEAALTAVGCQINAARDYASCMASSCPALFMCNDGTATLQKYVCDGDNDCPGGEDEPGDCVPEVLTCNDGTTFPATFRCDGEPDCDGGEDEPADCVYDCDARWAAAANACGDIPDAAHDRIAAECDGAE